MKTLGLSIIVIVVAGLFFPMVVGAQRDGRPPWPKKEGVYLATSSETIPLFAGVLAGYRDAGSVDFWDMPFALHGTIRIFEGTDWAGIPEFPNSGNHCGEGMFMIRWRSANPDVRVASTLAFSPDTVSVKAKTGSFGYMFGSNCEQPLFKFARTVKGNKSNLVDIHYELKFWQAAP